MGLIVTDELKDRIERFTHNEVSIFCAFSIKINHDKIEVDQNWQGEMLEEIKTILPPHDPRFVMINYPLKKVDGRIIHKRLVVFISPPGSSHQIWMLYASTKSKIKFLASTDKALEIRSFDELTDENVQAELRD